MRLEQEQQVEALNQSVRKIKHTDMMTWKLRFDSHLCLHMGDKIQKKKKQQQNKKLTEDDVKPSSL
jgi:hypothetical protein